MKIRSDHYLSIEKSVSTLFDCRRQERYLLDYCFRILVPLTDLVKYHAQEMPKRTQICKLKELHLNRISLGQLKNSS